jgi:hypothetical protein
MSKVNNLLFSRLKQKFSKMSELAEVSSQGNLSSFAGVFKIHPLSSQEKQSLEELLNSYKNDTHTTIQEDFQALIHITSEIKAINNQAALLHGERIKKAQEILKNYRDGAFSSWLIATYGNRQTPYNFLQYYEFYLELPPHLHSKLDEIPRQAIYTLASRDAPFEKKQELLLSCNGQTKKQLLSLIRQTFPLEDADKRKVDLPSQALTTLQELHKLFSQKQFSPTPSQKQQLHNLLQSLLSTFSL